ncbi:MAG: hypothetical protein HY678_10275 [Chloroflexi bacterium]|nr:hypothetical protein [Chloroflexota bacterium]
MMDQGELEKSGECVWGSMAAALKAVAVYRGIRLPSHRQVREYGRVIARDLHDPEIWSAVNAAELLHVNFYESDRTRSDVLGTIEQVRPVIGKLLGLIPKGVVETLTLPAIEDDSQMDH